MEFKINAELVSQVLNVIAGAKNTGLSFLELNVLLKQLQQLPKIEVEKKVETGSPEPIKPVEVDKKK